MSKEKAFELYEILLRKYVKAYNLSDYEINTKDFRLPDIPSGKGLQLRDWNKVDYYRDKAKSLALNKCLKCPNILASKDRIYCEKCRRRILESNKKRMAKLLKEGICHNCKSAPVTGRNKRFCEDCCKKAENRLKIKRKLCIKTKVCYSCKRRPASENKRRCDYCAKREKISKAKIRETLRAKGICRDCKKNALALTSKYRCEKCLSRLREKYKKITAKCAINNICSRCKKNKVDCGKYSCTECSKKKSIQVQKNKEKKKLDSQSTC